MAGTADEANTVSTAEPWVNHRSCPSVREVATTSTDLRAQAEAGQPTANRGLVGADQRDPRGGAARRERSGIRVAIHNNGGESVGEILRSPAVGIDRVAPAEK